MPAVIAHRILPRAAVALLALVLSACATGPGYRAAEPDGATKSRAAEVAAAMEGEPYRWGGASPAGFDCSGLVHYAYRQAGIRLPRTTGEQYRIIRQRYVEQLEPGDLIFFSIRSVRASHVGMYIGDGRFVHALNPRNPVRIDRVDDDYWAGRIVRAGSPRI